MNDHLMSDNRWLLLLDVNCMVTINMFLVLYHFMSQTNLILLYSIIWIWVNIVCLMRVKIKFVKVNLHGIKLGLIWNINSRLCICYVVSIFYYYYEHFYYYHFQEFVFISCSWNVMKSYFYIYKKVYVITQII